MVMAVKQRFDQICGCYLKITKKDVLAKVPDEKRFGADDKECTVRVPNYTENKLLKQLRAHQYGWVKVVIPCQLKVYKYHLEESDLSVILWVSAAYNGSCYRRYVEGACSYC